MSSLVWDQVGDRRYQTGIDRGVLYLPNGYAVPWNGLVSIDESTSRTAKSYYLDGVKYLEHQTPGDFAGTLKALTYPTEFDELVGTRPLAAGMYVHDQTAKPFGLSYRTLLGNDVDGTEFGYRVHVLWNLLAIPGSIAHSTMGDTLTPTEFSWGLSATPEFTDEFKPTAHLSFDSVDLDPLALAALEKVLYGTNVTNPTLPTMADLISIVTTGDASEVKIIDNGDDTWTASGISVEHLPDDMFRIKNIDLVDEDAESFTIATTE